MPQINWGEFINLEYWLEGLAGTRGAGNSESLIIQSDSWSFWAYLGIFATFVILSIILKASQTFFDKQHPFQNHIPTWSSNLALMGVLGFVWFFFREINVTMLNTRIWVLVGLVWLLVFLGLVAKYFITFYPLEIKAYKKRLEKKE